MANRICSKRVLKSYLRRTLVVITMISYFTVWYQDEMRQLPVMELEVNFTQVKVHHPTTKKPLLASPSNFRHVKVHHPTTKKPLLASPSNFRQVKVHHPTTKKPLLKSPSNFTQVTVHHHTTKKPLLASPSNFSNVKVHHNPTNSTSNPLLVSPSPVEPKDLKSIQRYHSEERRMCEQKMANTTEVNWCPCIPPGLQGRVFVNMIDDKDWDRIVATVGDDVLVGGEWRPPDCVSHTRLAIVIPCRGREHHLRVLLRHLIPILKRQLVHFRVFVVDQRFPEVFNKAATMNIGFLEAAKRFFFDCVIFHDVDMVLEDDWCLMTCGPQPRHYARSVDKFNYGLYPTFGGVVSIKPELFRMINGYSMRYFGWGGEDDDMWRRIRQVSSMYMPPPAICRYSTIPHERDTMNPVNPIRHALIAAASHSHDGLSDLDYKVNVVQLTPLFTRIESDISIAKLSAYYPSHPIS